MADIGTTTTPDPELFQAGEQTDVRSAPNGVLSDPALPPTIPPPLPPESPPLPGNDLVKTEDEIERAGRSDTGSSR